MAKLKIEEIEGIGPVFGEKLRAAGVADSDALLAACRTPKAREELAAKTGLAAAKVLKFANMADLFRIHGIGPEFAELLEAAGVDTVPELARRNAENLAAAMAGVKETKKLTRRAPTAAEVAKWVAEAKQLPRALEY
ncbi:MAG: DUF4332 domain-containing protein [Thermoanaerobaculia bacterium]|nr:DUF4332 domain-containing protein [Thermoanaerobaculia bacterium]